MKRALIAIATFGGALWARRTHSIQGQSAEDRPSGRRWSRGLKILALATVGALAFAAMFRVAPAHADRFMANYMTTWSSCDVGCTGMNPLSSTDEQASYFVAKMNQYGHTNTYFFANNDVYSSDILEDRDVNGQDYLYADDAEIYLFSGHGGQKDNWDGQTFYVPMCHDPSSWVGCEFDAEFSRLGERSGYYATPHNGDLRWMIWATCFSVDTDPVSQWKQTLKLGPDAVMGYRGLSADSWFTDEVPEDFAIQAWGPTNYTLKGSWFYAVEDFWIDDIGAIIVPGRAAYPGSQADANYTLNNMTRLWSRRAAGQEAGFFAWAQHSG
jgi:hypothetical protein